MKKALFATLATLILAGCGQSTLIVRGNTGLEQYIAKAAIAVHSEVCSQLPAQKRVAKVDKRNHETYTYVRHDCKN